VTIDDAAIERLEITLGRLLRAGVTLAGACMTIGLVIWIVRGRGHFASPLLTAGLIILMMTPLARVFASLVVYAKQRDWFFVTTTLLVFVVLIAAWLLRG
jgi:uncharacterized membrane protein